MTFTDVMNRHKPVAKGKRAYDNSKRFPRLKCPACGHVGKAHAKFGWNCEGCECNWFG